MATSSGADAMSAARGAGDTTTSSATVDLGQAARALAGAARTLSAMASSASQALQDLGGQGAGGGDPAINAWEDDPYSEAVASVNPPLAPTRTVPRPVNSSRYLRTSIVGSRPAPGRYEPGTENFRYWVAEEALVRGINFWAPLLPAGTIWSTADRPMRVTLAAGQALNANYSREYGLRFFQQTVRGTTISSAESADAVLHELGHAILDAIRPPLYNAASLEVAAFHEAFGDMSSILVALQSPALSRMVIAETQGRLNVTSRLSRVAEQLGWGLRQLWPTAVDADSLRNAANRFFYQRPALLPPLAPASNLSSAAHSFARVFTGAFLDALADMVDTRGPATEASLLTVSQDLGRLLVDGVLTAPIISSYYSSVASSMIEATQTLNGGRYRAALARAFIQRGILSVSSVQALASAAVPPLVPSASTRTADVGAASGGSRALRTHGGGEIRDYARGYGETGELSVRTIPTAWGKGCAVHAPVESIRFDVAPSPTLPGAGDTASANDDTRHFVEDLLQRGRVKFGPVPGVAPWWIDVTAEDDLAKTHEIMASPDGLILKRRHFDCGFCGHH